MDPLSVASAEPVRDRLLGFGAIALVVIAATGVHLVRMRRAVEDADTRRERMGELHRERERRGF